MGYVCVTQPLFHQATKLGSLPPKVPEGKVYIFSHCSGRYGPVNAGEGRGESERREEGRKEERKKERVSVTSIGN